MEESGVDSLPYLQYTNFLSLSDKESVIVRTIIPVYVSGKGRERDQSSASPHKTPSLTGPLTQL